MNDALAPSTPVSIPDVQSVSRPGPTEDEKDRIRRRLGGGRIANASGATAVASTIPANPVPATSIPVNPIPANQIPPVAGSPLSNLSDADKEIIEKNRKAREETRRLAAEAQAKGFADAGQTGMKSSFPTGDPTEGISPAQLHEATTQTEKPAGNQPIAAAGNGLPPATDPAPSVSEDSKIAHEVKAEEAKTAPAAPTAEPVEPEVDLLK